MTDRNVQFPNRYQLTKVPGTDDIYDLTPAPGTITEEGTMINKASLLTDETAQAYGFPAEQLADVVPDDVLKMLVSSAFIKNGELTNINGEVVGVQVNTGSYSGTGGTGAKSLSFPFTPYLVIVMGNKNSAAAGIGRVLFMVRSANMGHAFAASYSAAYGVSSSCTLTWNDTGVSWSGARNAVFQMNYSSNKYYYIAIGFKENET